MPDHGYCAQFPRLLHSINPFSYFFLLRPFLLFSASFLAVLCVLCVNAFDLYANAFDL